MVLEEPTGMNTNFTEGCWVRFISSGAYPYKILKGQLNHIWLLLYIVLICRHLGKLFFCQFPWPPPAQLLNAPLLGQFRQYAARDGIAH